MFSWPGERTKSVIVLSLTVTGGRRFKKKGHSNILTVIAVATSPLTCTNIQMVEVECFHSFWQNQPIFTNFLALKPFFLSPWDPHPAFRFHLFYNNVQVELILGNLIDFVIVCYQIQQYQHLIFKFADLVTCGSRSGFTHWFIKIIQFLRSFIRSVWTFSL